MATITENLQTLNEAKLAIKAAIENKGQDLTDIPFTQYAEKIDAIGGVPVQDLLNISLQARYLFSGVIGYANNRPSNEQLNEWINQLDFSQVVDIYGMFSYSKLKSLTDKITFPSVKSAESVFSKCYDLVSLPENLFYNNGVYTKIVNLNGMFIECEKLLNVPMFDTSEATSMGLMFAYAHSLTEVPAYDCRNITNFSSTFYQTESLQNCWIKNIKTSLSFAQSPLTQESLIHLIGELRTQTSNTIKTLSVSPSCYAKIENVYIRKITDETILNSLRETDDLVDEKVPFEICESTDSDAMLITDYATSKYWNIAT